MTDVLFGQSYYLRFDPKLYRLMQPYPPLGTLIAAAAVRARGYDVGLFDAMLADSETEWEAALDAHRPRVAVLYEDSFNYLSKMCLLRMRRAAFVMLAAARRRGCVTLVCGSDASDQPQAYLENGADIVIVGEGEETLTAVLDRVTGRAPGPIGEVDGVVTVDGNTKTVVRAAPRAVMTDIDQLPYPAWDLVDVGRYRALWLSHHGYYAVNMVTTRGCPFHCNWCAKPIWGQRYTARRPERVAAELVELTTSCRPDRIWFADDILGLEPGWMTGYADDVARHRVRVPFKCQSRVDLLLRDGEIESFARAGAHTVWVGAESGSQRVLDAMEKGTRVEQIGEATRRLRAAGIRVGFFLQFGYPGEQWDDIEATRRMVRDCQPDEIGISVSYPLPGTPFHARVKAELGAKQNWIDSDDLDMMFVGTFATAFYRQLYRVVHKEFRARTAARRLFGVPTARSSDGGRLRLAGAALYHGATWPFERFWLDRLTRRPAGPSPVVHPGLTPREAAEPTPQERT